MQALPPPTVHQLVEALAVTRTGGAAPGSASGSRWPIAIAPIGVHCCGTPNRVRKSAMISGWMPKNTVSHSHPIPLLSLDLWV